MLYLSGEDLQNLVAPSDLVAVIEQALRDFAQGVVNVPTRGHVGFHGNTLLTMPVTGGAMVGAKIVTVVPENAGRELPVVQGLMTLFDGTTGTPLAILDAAMLTAQRTGAVGAVGLKYTTPEDLDRIGVIGVGVQGIWQAIFACAVRRIRTVYFVARSHGSATKFIEAVSQRVPGVELVRCRDVRTLLSEAPAVIVATTSSVPVLPADRELLKNKHMISVGSFKPSMRELPDVVAELAGHMVIDSDAAKTEVGDLIAPLAAGLLRPEDIIHLAELVVGTRSVDIRGTTAVKSVGMALYDLYAAEAFFVAASRTSRGTVLNAS
jgi:ornithine cyclodeaminase